MPFEGQAKEISFKSRVWDVVQKVVASVLFACLSAAAYFIVDTRANISDTAVHIDQVKESIKPIAGLSMRESVLDLQSRANKSHESNRELYGLITQLKKDMDSEDERLLRFISEVNVKCEKFTSRCDWFMDNHKN